MKYVTGALLLGMFVVTMLVTMSTGCNADKNSVVSMNPAPPPAPEEKVIVARFADIQADIKQSNGKTISQNYPMLHLVNATELKVAQTMHVYHKLELENADVITVDPRDPQPTTQYGYSKDQARSTSQTKDPPKPTNCGAYDKTCDFKCGSTTIRVIEIPHNCTCTSWSEGGGTIECPDGCHAVVVACLAT